MGLFESAEERATKQALALAADPPLGVTARSKPAGEVRSQGCALGLIVIVLAAFAVPVILAILYGAAGEEEPRRTLIILAVLVFAGLVLSSLVKGWRSRRSDYVDPELEIAAGPEGVSIAGPRGRHLVRYADVRARVRCISVRHSVRFVGVTMSSPVGMIELDDAFYTNGRHVAAMVLRGAHEACGLGA